MNPVTTGSIITVARGTEVSKLSVGSDTIIVRPCGSAEIRVPLSGAKAATSPALVPSKPAAAGVLGHPDGGQTQKRRPRRPAHRNPQWSDRPVPGYERNGGLNW